VEVANLPTVEAVQKAMKSKNKTDNRKGNMMPKSSFGCKSGQRKKFYSPLDFAHRDYWVGLGHPVEKSPDGWVVKLSKTTICHRLTLRRRHHGRRTLDKFRQDAS